MPTLQIWTVEVSNRSTDDKVVDVANLSTAQRLASLITSASSQTVQSDGADFVCAEGQYLQLFCDGAINIAADAAPVASASDGMYVPAGTLTTLSVRPGDKVAVSDA